MEVVGVLNPVQAFEPNLAVPGLVPVPKPVFVALEPKDPPPNPVRPKGLATLPPPEPLNAVVPGVLLCRPNQLVPVVVGGNVGAELDDRGPSELRESRGGGLSITNYGKGVFCIIVCSCIFTITRDRHQMTSDNRTTAALEGPYRQRFQGMIRVWHQKIQ
jgi:hypothetical protein